jgi:hypothetical protein
MPTPCDKLFDAQAVLEHAIQLVLVHVPDDQFRVLMRRRFHELSPRRINRARRDARLWIAVDQALMRNPED